MPKTAFLTLVAFLFVFLVQTGPAHADISVSPLRVVFDDRQRTAEVTLLNLTNQTKVYRVGWTYFKMKNTGEYERLEGPLSPVFDPAKAIVFSPRQVTVLPESRQKVRLSLRRPPELPDGEYRAHMVFQKLPEAKKESGARSVPRGVEPKINVRLGIAIPVIVRQGAYDATATLSNPSFVPVGQSKTGKPRLRATINRQGTKGTLGKVTVFWDRADTPGNRIGILNNVNLFPEINTRNVEVDLNVDSISGGNITIRYEGEGPQKGIIYDEKVIPVGG